MSSDFPSHITIAIGMIRNYVRDDNDRFAAIIRLLSERPASPSVDNDSDITPINQSTASVLSDSELEKSTVTERDDSDHSGCDTTKGFGNDPVSYSFNDDTVDDDVVSTTSSQYEEWNGIPTSPLPVPSTPPPIIRKRSCPTVNDSDSEVNDYPSLTEVPVGTLGIKGKGKSSFISQQVVKGLWVNGLLSIQGAMAPTRDRSDGPCERCVRFGETKCLVLRDVNRKRLPFYSISCGNCLRAGQGCK